MTLPKPAALLQDSVLRRRTMVDCQVKTFDVTNQPVLERMLEVPRELFLPDEWKELAYSDNALEITVEAPKAGVRYVLPPLILARMLQEATLGSTDKVLDIASGMGYSTAVLAGLVGKLTSLESHRTLADRIASALDACSISTVDVVEGPLANGWLPQAPYDVIIVNGAVEAGLDALFAQLAEGGRLITIQQVCDDFGGRANQAIRFEKNAGKISSRFLFDASAPLLQEFRQAPQFVF